MQKTTTFWAVPLSLCAALLFGGQSFADTAAKSGSGKEHSHAHDHAHSHGHDDEIYKGYFKDSQVAERPLSDWAGSWQSVYPYLQDGTLDPVFAHKAEHGDKTPKQYRDYYEAGYKTDIDRIVIEGDKVTFQKKDGSVTGRYASDSYEILTYEKGNRGVRYVFKKVEGDAAAPSFMQFSDHRIAPAKADHYHLYLGDDRAALLKEVTNWPTYYGASLSGKDVVHEMMHH